MTDTPRPAAPALTAVAEAARQARLEREAQALRANLRRRKDQARGRLPTNPAPPQATSPDHPAPTEDEHGPGGSGTRDMAPS